MTLDKAIADALRATTTATLTTVLLKKGIRRCWMNGPMPLFNAGERVVGRAFTLRFVPAREDLATPESWSSPRSTRAAIEDMPEGCIAVVDAMGVQDAGIFGDILTARMRKRGVAALVTDGVVRDGEGWTARGCPCGARASRRRRPSPASPSWVGRSRSAAAASRSIPTTWWWRTATARC
jgi:regulator of RNase E activity RraA